jgi:hypothetical protein
VPGQVLELVEEGPHPEGGEEGVGPVVHAVVEQDDRASALEAPPIAGEEPGAEQAGNTTVSAPRTVTVSNGALIAGLIAAYAFDEGTGRAPLDKP